MTNQDVHHTAALAPPEGVESDFVNGYSLHTYLIATVVLCLVSSTVAVSARCYTKIRLLHRFEIEDYALIFAALGFTAFAGVMVGAGNAGQGRHQWNVTIAGLQRIALLANILEVVYPPVMFAAKFAILVQIKRIFATHQRTLTYLAAHVLICLNFFVYTALFFAFIFACWPREKIWNPHVPGRCISTNASIIATSAINIVSDFSILVLPLFSILSLQLSAKKKAGVAAVFGTGLFACIASIIRLYYSIKLTKTHDITWAIAPVGMWALAEFATVMLVGCFPTFPRLWKHIRGRDGNSELVIKLIKSGERKPKPSSLTKSTYPSQWYNRKSQVSHSSWIPLNVNDNEMDRTSGPSSETRIPSAHIYKQTDIEFVTDDQK